MKILILGATGGTGQQLVSQALEKGYEVTAFVREPSKLKQVHPKLTIVKGNVLDKASLSKALEGKDVVLSALGVGMSLKPNHLIANATELLIPAMNTAGVKRIIFLSAFGVGETFNQANFIQKLMYRFVVKDVFADKEIGDNMLRSSSLDWTLVYPTGLTNGTQTGKYRVGERLPMKGFPKISRADVAEFMIQQINSREWLKKIAVISY
ncbi:MAG TPA: SDR family oxidoreductase [Chitinophagales bacterium]|nr:SDR family oxidoreductase [Chitinophagales bacterium]